MAIFPVLYDKSLLLIYLIHSSLHLLIQRRRRAWQPTLVFLPGESPGQRSLVDYSPWGHKELDSADLDKGHKSLILLPSSGSAACLALPQLHHWNKGSEICLLLHCLGPKPFGGVENIFL